MKKKLFSITRNDCEWQYFRAGGKGGQSQNKKSSGVRCIHKPSGAIGESREERSQWQNRQAAFKRMAATPAFIKWANREASKDLISEAEIQLRVEKSMAEKNLKVETRVDNKWIELDKDKPVV